jgi:hypothetical protein
MHTSPDSAKTPHPTSSSGILAIELAWLYSSALFSKHHHHLIDGRTAGLAAVQFRKSSTSNAFGSSTADRKIWALPGGGFFHFKIQFSDTSCGG